MGRILVGRRMRSMSLAVAVAATLVAVGCSSSSTPSAAPATAMHHDTTPPAGGAVDGADAVQLARARSATARYVTDLAAAQTDGYRIITPMMPDMGYHFLNPSTEGFDVERPPILVYLRDGGAWQLGALEWVFPEKPATPPLAGATYGTFGAACHYDDGTFVFADAQTACVASSPDTGSPFVFWHPPLVTMHVWLWYPNPDGLFSGTNPLVTPFNEPAAVRNATRTAHIERWQTTHGA
jgi:hypothetical protein